jgi:hypothetical protein
MLADLAPLGDEDDCPEDVLSRVAAGIDSIVRPISTEEARMLLPLFARGAEDTLYGLMWSLLHLVETAPGWPPGELFEYKYGDFPWIDLLIERVQSGGLDRS